MLTQILTLGKNFAHVPMHVTLVVYWLQPLLLRKLARKRKPWSKRTPSLSRFSPSPCPRTDLTRPCRRPGMASNFCCWKEWPQTTAPIRCSPLNWWAKPWQNASWSELLGIHTNLTTHQGNNEFINRNFMALRLAKKIFKMLGKYNLLILAWVYGKTKGLEFKFDWV